MVVAYQMTIYLNFCSPPWAEMEMFQNLRRRDQWFKFVVGFVKRVKIEKTGQQIRNFTVLPIHSGEKCIELDTSALISLHNSAFPSAPIPFPSYAKKK